MKEQLEKIKEEALKQIESSEALERLNDIRVSYLGKKGELTNLLKSMKDVAPEDRPKVGQMVNDVRGLIEGRLEEARTALRQRRPIQATSIPTPLPWKRWSAFSWAWDMRWWKALRWSTTGTTLRS